VGEAIRTVQAEGAAPGRDPADDCVHCGFCLPACPTWRSWGEEMDSPRGRIDLFRALSDGRVRLTAPVAEHFDRCLGCMACVPACPSGVRYDRIIEAARERVEELPRPAADRAFRALVFALFPHPGRLRVAGVLLWLLRATGLQRLLRKLGALRRLPRLAQLDALAPPVRLRELLRRLPRRVPARGERRLRVGLVQGCVQRVFFPEVNAATVRVLAAEGVEVEIPPQGCCGALSLHAGRREEARRMAAALLRRLEDASLDLVVVNAAGCGSHLKDLGHLFAGDPELLPRARALAARVRDVTELLATLPPRAPRGPLRARVAWHMPCHLGHAQRLEADPRAALRAIPGLELVELDDGGACCGSAGVYNLMEPGAAAEIGARKAEAIAAAGAPVLASANPGCTLHLGPILLARGLAVRAVHPVELVDRSIREGDRHVD
jgi:glycolate oxidase iron-sulfur subunit